MTVIAISTAADFAQWLASTHPACVYHIGILGDASLETRKLAEAVWKAAVKREVYLLQRRQKRGEPMEYLAVKPAQKVPERFAPDAKITYG